MVQVHCNVTQFLAPPQDASKPLSNRSISLQRQTRSALNPMGHPATDPVLGLRIRPGRKEPLHHVGTAVAGRHMKRPLTSVGGLYSCGFGSVAWREGNLLLGEASSSCFFFQWWFLICKNTTHKLIRHGLHMHTLSLSNKNKHEA